MGTTVVRWPGPILAVGAYGGITGRTSHGYNVATTCALARACPTALRRRPALWPSPDGRCWSGAIKMRKSSRDVVIDKIKICVSGSKKSPGCRCLEHLRRSFQISMMGFPPRPDGPAYITRRMADVDHDDECWLRSIPWNRCSTWSAAQRRYP